MLLPVFEKYIFLQALGWGIAHSFWQVALLWLLYQIPTTVNTRLSAIFKHYFSLVLLTAAFAWFLLTVVQNYFHLRNTGAEPGLLDQWVSLSGNVSVALRWVSVAYIILLAAHLVQFIKQLKGLHLLKNSRRTRPGIETRLFAAQTALHLGIRKKVTVWLSENVDVPSVIGFFKPMILLPVTALNNLSTQQAEAVILHELAHIKRHDYLFNLLQSLMELVLFFNPFARLLGSHARRERENCCDDWVINYRYNRHDYASALVILEQNRHSAVQLALAATNGKKNLLHRVRRLFVTEPAVRLGSMQQAKLTTLALTLAIGIFLVLPVISGQQQQAQQLPVTTLVSPASAFLETPVNTYIETNAVSIKNNPPVSIVKKIEKEKPVEKVVPAAVTYTSALINEELLNADQHLQEVAVLTANTGLEKAESVLVKIEEEKAGTKNRITYLIELKKNNSGVTEIKPLMLLDQKIETEKHKIADSIKLKMADSLKTTQRKRITS